MLYNVVIKRSLTTVGDMLEEMTQMPNEFVLTGSRYFGNWHDKSDWDMFTPHNVVLEDKLYHWGFQKLSDSSDCGVSSYSDFTIVKVMEKTFQDGVVQIQLLQPEMFKVKKAVNAFLKNHYSDRFSYMSKQERKEVWRILLDLAASCYLSPMSNDIGDISGFGLKTMPKEKIVLEF